VMGRAVLPALALALLSFPAPAAGGEAAPAAHTYLIMPFENTAEDPSLAWLSTGLALSFGEYLIGAGAQVIDEDDRSVLLESNGIPAGAPITLATALELGRKMRARPGGPDRMVLGRFNVADGDLTVTARTIDLGAAKARPWLSRQGHLKDLLQVENDLFITLAKADGSPMSESKSDILAKQSRDLPLLAYEHYCRAMAEPDTKKRLQILKRATQEFPGYPKAGYQAAALLAKADRWDDAREFLGKIGADPYPYESSFYLLHAAVDLRRHDAEGAKEAARRALGFAESARGHAILGKALLAGGDRDGASKEAQKASELDASEPEIEDLRRALAEHPQPARRNP
jgi:tetratricopeptide (TPR) repeat protein